MASDIVRELFIKIGVASDKASFSIIEDRLQSIRQIMSSIVDLTTKLTKVVMTFAEAGANLEATEVQFGTLARSMDLGLAKLKELNKFAAETPFTLPEVRQNTSMLIAMGVALEDVIPTMTRLGNVASGLPNLSLQRLALNFGQVKSQGHLTGRELRDFAVGGVPILESLSEITGRTDKQLRDMISDKKISFDLVDKAFRHMVSNEGRFHKLLDKMAKSARGLYNNILVVRDLIAEGVGKKLLEDIKPVLKEVKDFLFTKKHVIIKKLTNVLKVLTKLMLRLFKIFFKLSVAMVPVVENLAAATLSTIDFVAAIISFITTNDTFIKALKSATLAAFAFAAGLLAIELRARWMVAGGFLAVVKGIGTALWTAAKAAWAFTVVQGVMIKKALLLATPFLLIGAAILGAILLVQDFYTFLRGDAEGIETETGIGGLIDKLANGSDRLKDFMTEVLRLMMGPLILLVALVKATWAALTGGNFFDTLANDQMLIRLKESWGKIKNIIVAELLIIQHEFHVWWRLFKLNWINRWNSLSDTVKNIFRLAALHMFSPFDAMISKTVSALNALIKTYNSLSSYIPGAAEMDLLVQPNLLDFIVPKQQISASDVAASDANYQSTITESNKRVSYDQRNYNIYDASPDEYRQFMSSLEDNMSVIGLTNSGEK